MKVRGIKEINNRNKKRRRGQGLNLGPPTNNEDKLMHDNHQDNDLHMDRKEWNLS